MFQKDKKRLYKILPSAVILMLAAGTSVIFGISSYISNFSVDYIYTDLNKLPANRVGIVPGTSKYLVDGKKNRYYLYRIEAAVYLFKNKKIEYVLVSGDNATKYYNEPVGIKKDLVEMGIPDNKIFLDYAGFRTLDTVVRARDIFDLNKFTFISQPFHNERAIFIAKKHGLDAIGYNARDVERLDAYKTTLREYFARIIAFLDIYVLNTSPRFGGEKIKIK